MRKLVILPLLLAGCAPIMDMLAPAYIPQPIHIFDEAKYAADDADCAAAGKAWKPQVSWASGLTATIDGATADTSLIPLSPLVPLYGAAGGAAKAASDGLDLASKQHSNVYKNCLFEATHRDGSAIIADPRE